MVAHHLKVKIHFIFFSAAAGILIFRGELAIFLGLFLLMDLTVGRARLLPTLGYGFISLVIKKKFFRANSNSRYKYKLKTNRKVTPDVRVKEVTADC